jgi:hypothetical protein
MRTLEIVAIAADGAVTKDVISGHFTDGEAVIFAASMFPDHPVVEVWEQGALVVYLGAAEQLAGRSIIKLAKGTALSRAQELRDRFHRWGGEWVLAAIGGVLCIMTAGAPDWVEASGGFDFDGGSGVGEWLLTAVVMLVATLAAVSARRRRLRLDAQPEKAGALNASTTKRAD